MERLRSIFLDVQFTDNDGVFNTLLEEGVSGDYITLLRRRIFERAGFVTSGRPVVLKLSYLVNIITRICLKYCFD